MRRSRRAQLAGEAGFIVPVSLAILVAALLLLAAAAARSISANHTAIRSTRSERALQAADTGLRMVQYRLNGLGLDLRQVLNLSKQCLVNAGSLLNVATLPAGSAWCAPVTEDLGNGTSYTYYASAVADLSPLTSLSGSTNFTDTLKRKIVSIGTACTPSASPCTPGQAGSVSRRVRIALSAPVQITNTKNLLSDSLVTNLQLYTPDAGSFRECSPAYSSSFNPQSPDC